MIRTVVAALLAVATAAACVAGVPTSASPAGSTSSRSAAPSPGSSSPDLDTATLAAIRFRKENALPADLDHILAVAADPSATTEFGVPLLPAEVQELFARNTRADAIVPIVRSYAAQHPDVFGGVWLDQSKGGIVTVSFTDDLGPHRAALADLLAGAGIVIVVPARYAEATMRAAQDRVAANRAWFESIPARLQGVGYSETQNVLEVDVSTKNPDITELIAAHFDLPLDGLVVNSDGTGSALLPWGTVKGRVLTAAGKPPGVNDYLVDGRGTDPGSCGGGDVGFGVLPDGTFNLPCQTGHRVIVVLDFPPDGGESAVVGHGEVDVRPGAVSRVTIHLDPTP